MDCGAYARLMRNVYVEPWFKLLVAMLKIHWLPVQRKATSGMSFVVVSFTTVMVPRTSLSMVKEPAVPAKTAAGLEMGLPKASHTVNLTGIVLPPLRLYTLVPSLLIGGSITPPAPELQALTDFCQALLSANEFLYVD